jgi:hypothetical protein
VQEQHYRQERAGELPVWKWNSLVIITEVKAAVIGVGSRLITASFGCW